MNRSSRIERILNIASMALIILIGGALGTVFTSGEGIDANSAEAQTEKPSETKSTETKSEPVHGDGAKAEATSEAKPHIRPEKVTRNENGEACVTGAALEDLSAARERLAAKERELAQKEAELKAFETAVKKEFSRIEQARQDLAGVETLKKKENEEKVAKIVETLETMSPKASASLIATLDDALAVTALQRMATPKLAKVMNLLDPGRSSRLTELMAGVVRARSNETASRDVAGLPNRSSAKGGDRK